MADFVKNDNKKKNFNNNRNSTPKVKDYGSKKEATITPPDVCAGTVEYTMSKLMADEILKAYKGNKTPQEVLCNYVNNECGLKGYCVKVIVDIN
jgi:UDP-glucose 4-epimerase